jgi:cobalt/nickel transport system ATP-binding protein
LIEMTTPALSIQNLSFHYADGIPALKNISFSLQPGERIALIGPNGAGKSTLLCHLNGIFYSEEAEETVEVFGIPVKKKNLPEIRRRVGLVFQDPDDQLFCPTIFDDVAFGPLNMGLSHDEVHHRVKEALHHVGLVGYESRSTFHLSGGEKKRVSLATVLAMDVDIIAFDEPSSNLDPKSRRGLIDWLKKTEKTLIVATHDLDLAYEIANRVIVLNQGTITGDGPVDAILKNEDFLLKNQLELPMRFQTYQK